MNPLKILRSMFTTTPRLQPLECAERVRSGEALLVDIARTQDPFERAQKAIDAFGAKAGPKLAQGLQASGRDPSYASARPPPSGVPPITGTIT